MDFSLPSRPPSPSLAPLPLPVDSNHLPSSSLSRKTSHNTLLIITISVFTTILLTLFIRIILRLLSSSSRGSSSAVVPASLLVRSNSSSSSSSAAVISAEAPSDNKKSPLIDSLPFFKLGSSLAALSKSSPDCAVCLRSFRVDEDLRLLPACFHAFHSNCVETWIRTSPSCPLCRAPVTLPPPTLPSSDRPTVKLSGDDSRNPPLPLPLASPPRRLTYSIESSFDYPSEEDIEAAVERIQRLPSVGTSVESGPPPPGEEVAAAAGGGSRRWLKDYIDRVMSTRSSSFRSASSSFRFSGRWIHHHEEYRSGEDGRYFMDWEVDAGQVAEDDDGGLAALYRWIAGV
ncbi:hypothetical protein Cni_G07417 [Canna indica]|uniref:RING-type E3 ubiquitin transferase n=1 Tax=Canna indica TaxID=4628 RepID=A0AAQ3K3W5_9LILI|nr:hypothetical protein Cni_G07417 [Canna indica]